MSPPTQCIRSPCMHSLSRARCVCVCVCVLGVCVLGVCVLGGLVCYACAVNLQVLASEMQMLDEELHEAIAAARKWYQKWQTTNVQLRGQLALGDDREKAWGEVARRGLQPWTNHTR